MRKPQSGIEQRRQSVPRWVAATRGAMRRRALAFRDGCGLQPEPTAGGGCRPKGVWTELRLRKVVVQGDGDFLYVMGLYV